jgi:uncharacterized membrane protein YGL010W
VRTIHDWFDAYAESHRHPLNKLIHWICVPAITFSVLGIAWAWSPWGALGIAALALGYYLRLSAALAAGMAAAAAIMLGVLSAIERTLWPSIAVFVLAWLAQIWGHHVEGRKPSFLQDVQFLLIGPLWLLHAVYRRLGLRV